MTENCPRCGTTFWVGRFEPPPDCPACGVGLEWDEVFVGDDCPPLFTLAGLNNEGGENGRE